MLEDRYSDIFTDLTGEDNYYESSLLPFVSDANRFYIHAYFNYVGNTEFSIENNNFVVIPNRNSGIINVKEIHPKSQKLSVFDMSGKQVFTTQLNGQNDFAIPFGQMKRGGYLIQLITDQNLESRKVIW